MEVDNIGEQENDQVEENPADDQIERLLQTFNVTRDMVSLAGIDLTVLGFLPEEEIVSILSGLASDMPQDQDNAEDNKEEEQVQDQNEEVKDNQPVSSQENQPEPIPSEENKENLAEPVVNE